MNITVQITFVVLSYLLGAIPSGYLLTKFTTGKNILEMGSGNIGSTNVGRIAGRKISVITQLLDMLKGLIPVAVYIFLMDQKIEGVYIFLIALATIIGHDFSIFLNFKGGKGVNTTLGASVLIAPLPVFISVAIYFIIKWRFKYVSLGSIILAIALPASELILSGLSPVFYYLSTCMILILFLHRSNMSRLWHKQELPS